jgi:hypothetical protein
MTNNRTQFDRRTLADDAKYLSILDRRYRIANRRLRKKQIELAMTRLGLKIAMVGIVASWLLFVSEVMGK